MRIGLRIQCISALKILTLQVRDERVSPWHFVNIANGLSTETNLKIQSNRLARWGWNWFCFECESQKETGQDWDKIAHITNGTHSIYPFFLLNFFLLAEKTVENERK